MKVLFEFLISSPLGRYVGAGVDLEAAFIFHTGHKQSQATGEASVRLHMLFYRESSSPAASHPPHLAEAGSSMTLVANPVLE